MGGMSVLQKLVKYGEAALRPTLVNGKWKRPMISRRQAAVVRKTALIEGTFGSVDPVKGGWIPDWDLHRAPWVMRPPKLHKRERTRQRRADKIDQALETHDQRYLDSLKERHARKEQKSHENFIKKLTQKVTKDSK